VAHVCALSKEPPPGKTSFSLVPFLAYNFKEAPFKILAGYCPPEIL
jgi:hypothetical protein